MTMKETYRWKLSLLALVLVTSAFGQEEPNVAVPT